MACAVVVGSFEAVDHLPALVERQAFLSNGASGDVSEKAQVGELWLSLASMFGREITRPVLKLMLDSVDDLPASAVISVLENWAKNANARSHPLPGEIRHAINPKPDDRSVAVDLAKRITAAVVRRGYTWPSSCRYDGHKSFEDAVTAELGELGWTVIRRAGGWQRVHDDYFDSEPAIFNAQLRDHIEFVVKLAKAGTLDLPPALPEGKHSDVLRLGGLTSVGDVANKILIK